MTKQKISLLVPFRANNVSRNKDWRWLKKYWRNELKGQAEIVIGHDYGGTPFSKTQAINEAAKRARGDVFVILDADTYIPGDVIAHAAARIRSARERGVKLWFVPYRHLFRLTQAASKRALDSDPKHPYRFPSPPAPEDIEDTVGSLFGHKYGALIMILPREAFEEVGCMDPRFRGWGGEDVSYMRAVDTLWTRHKNLPDDVLHLWHPTQGAKFRKLWDGQATPRANDKLAMRYHLATGHPAQMRELVDSGCNSKGRKHWLRKLWHWVLAKLLDLLERLFRLF